MSVYDIKTKGKQQTINLMKIYEGHSYLIKRNYHIWSNNMSKIKYRHSYLTNTEIVMSDIW